MYLENQADIPLEASFLLDSLKVPAVKKEPSSYL